VEIKQSRLGGWFSLPVALGHWTSAFAAGKHKSGFIRVYSSLLFPAANPQQSSVAQGKYLDEQLAQCLLPLLGYGTDLVS